MHIFGEHDKEVGGFWSQWDQHGPRLIGSKQHGFADSGMGVVMTKYVVLGTLTTSELVTRMQSDKHNNMCHVAASLKHVNIHENVR